MFKILIKDINCNELTPSLYKNHGTFHSGDSGIDLFFPEKITIKAGETKLIGLKIHIQTYNIKEDKYEPSLLLPRSSISKTPLRMSNSLGLIDSEYTGELKVSVDNIKNYDYEIKKGERLFQIVHPSFKPLDIELVSSLRETSRGSGGFGSTNNT